MCVVLYLFLVFTSSGLEFQHMDMKEIKENWPWLPLVNGFLIVSHLFLMSF